MASAGEFSSKVGGIYRGAMTIRNKGATKHALHRVVHSHASLKYTKRREPNIFARRTNTCGESKGTSSAYEGTELGV